MSAALISLGVIVISAFAAAAGPLKVVGDGLLSNPQPLSNAPPGSGKGVRYAGPIVYSNEKPPIIYFPPPPKNAKPGFGSGPFGKKAKSIKYVPMPHHDLPVLIYTSNKTPPIHVIQPPKNEGGVITHSQQPVEDAKNIFGSPFQGPELSSSFGPSQSPFGHPEQSSARIVTSSYQIPSTSYGAPVNAFGSPHGSFDISSGSTSAASENQAQVQQQFGTPQRIPGVSFGPGAPPVPEHLSNPRPFGPGQKKLPNIVYSGQPPIHVFNEPDMFVHAPREMPYKTFDDMPPKASFGPPKSAFAPSYINSFHSPPSAYRPPFASFGPPVPQYRPSSFQVIPAKENIVSSSSTNQQTISPVNNFPSQNAPNVEPNAQASQAQGSTVQSVNPPQNSFSAGASSSYFGPYGQYAYNFAPSRGAYSFGPFSIEYGPPSEPFMSYSEPVGSLSSIYGAMSGNGPQNDWTPGPPPGMKTASPMDDAWLQAGSQPMSDIDSSYGPSFAPNPGHGPNPMHSSVMFPSGGGGGSPYGGSKLAHLFSSFKLKRNKPKYAIAPKSMHKPPIIIYYGEKPPVHVYQKPDGEQVTAHAPSASAPIPTSVSPDSSYLPKSNSVSNVNENSQTSSADNVDLTYAASQKSEVRVAPSASEVSPVIISPKPTLPPKPAIIPAKPVDIFGSGELQPSIYMARNSMNTIFVSDLSGSGTKAIKTYIVRSEDSDPMETASSRKLTVSQATVVTPNAEVDFGSNNHGSIPIAEDRISGEISSSADTEKEYTSDISEFSPLSIQPQGEKAESRQVVHSPSSFQTSLSQAEKEAEESVVS